MQAIQTKYHGPTNTRGSWVSAKCSAGSIRHGWDDGLNATQNHEAAARALIVKLHWHRNHARPDNDGDKGGQARPVWYNGGLDDGSIVWVCAWPDAVLDCSDTPARVYVSPIR